MAKEKGDEEGLQQRQEEVEGFWEKVDEEQIKPILDTHDESTRAILEKALYLREDDGAANGEGEHSPSTLSAPPDSWPADLNADSEPIVEGKPDASIEVGSSSRTEDKIDASNEMTSDVEEDSSSKPKMQPVTEQNTDDDSRRSAPILEGIKELRNAYMVAKRAYRIPPSRLKRVQEALSLYEGTHNYHNYTVQKSFSDPSAKRVIKSFVVNSDPILINGTEWLSLKVHGQSFMMHQIRKMVGMVALIVRCGCDPKRIVESYGPGKVSIPKAPSLGLLLERPVFNSYNKRAKHDLGREAIDFDKFRKEMDEFKQREIYERMYRDEEKDNM
jgi:tRNA pseudouridine38-40 synthase